MESVLDLGSKLMQLPPVQHAMCDPHFSRTCRPIDAAWHHAGFTDVMSGFNPSLHTHFYAAESAMARWLDDPGTPNDDHAHQVQLAKELMHLAHDYLHSWAYRALASIVPDLKTYGPITRSNLDEQAFFLVVTEAVAVVGLDYWYLCISDIDERCGVAVDVGPRTVHYLERLLPEYRRYNPSLTVQEPRFFAQIIDLYTTGAIRGFSEQDLLDSPPLASWLIRELLISPRQRAVCRSWLSHLAGFDLDPDELSRTFPRPSEALHQHLARLADLLWRKIKLGEELFFPLPTDAQSWCRSDHAAVDFRFVNLQRLPHHTLDRSTSRPSESSNFYIDQYLSRFKLPERAELDSYERLAREIELIKIQLDLDRLERLAATLVPVEHGAPDIAPLELMFVN